ncbi:MAG: hypothetical protein HRT77_08115, partial [Halioglobus sp.]|nr:hypothetical protein [Halioglobus sp.]
ERHILFIAGMHRSGTSALCSALERCGVTFGDTLLNPMAGVNEDGFWEDTELVRLNEQVLQRLGGAWYAPPPALDQAGALADSRFDDLKAIAQAIIARGFGAGPLQAVKDPRLCLTLPFWLAVCDQQSVAVSVCVMSRAPIEVALSLEKRDGFPVAYGLRLCADYWKSLSVSVPIGSLYVTYNDLLQNAAAVMARLGESLPLQLPPAGLGRTVKAELRHHAQPRADSPLQVADSRRVDGADLAAAIERDYPVEQLGSSLARCLVRRGEQLTALGVEHSRTLDTLTQRDGDVKALSALHHDALATIDERDEQIAALDRRLTETGAHLELALRTLQDRDGQIQRYLSIPVLGLLLRAMNRFHARG